MLGTAGGGVKRLVYRRHGAVQAFFVDGVREQTDRGHTGGARSRHRCRRLRRHATDGEHGNRRRLHDIPQRVWAGRCAAGLGGCREDRSEQEEVDGRFRGRISRLLPRMNGAADQEATRDNRPDAGGTDGIAPQVHAVRAGRARHIETVVHENPCARPAHGVDTRLDEMRQRPGVEVALADLHEIDSGTRRGADLAYKRVRIAGAYAAASSDHADHRRHLSSRIEEPPSVTIESRTRRAANSEKISANAVPRLTSPRPVTAPRTKLLVTSTWSSGSDSTK